MEYSVYSCSIWLKNNTVHGETIKKDFLVALFTRYNSDYATLISRTHNFMGIKHREKAMRTIDDRKPCQKMHTRLQKNANFWQVQRIILK